MRSEESRLDTRDCGDGDEMQVMCDFEYIGVIYDHINGLASLHQYDTSFEFPIRHSIG